MSPTFCSLRRTGSQLKSDLAAARDMLSLVLELRKFFGHRVILEEAREEIKRGLDQREKAFLELMRVQIYERGDGVYFKLLRMAACNFDDLQSHVARNGLENTLQKLLMKASISVRMNFEEKATG